MKINFCLRGTGNVVEENRNKVKLFLISNFRRVLNVVCLLLGNSPASEFYISTFRNILEATGVTIKASSPC
jgi:hypothetical protein